MSISGHSVSQDGTVKFTVTSPHHKFKESMTTRQLLAAQPVEPQSPLQVYQQLYESSTLIRSEINATPHKLETMLLDYVDSGHIQAAQEIIQSCLSSGYYPSETMVLILTDILLKRTKIKNKEQRKEKVEQHYMAHALLLHILNIYGPKVLTPIWFKLGTTLTGRKRRRYQRNQPHTHSTTGTTDTTNQDNNYDDDDDDDDDDGDDGIDQHGRRISRFDDFWHLVSYCFTQPTNKLSLNTLGCRLTLDVLIKLISADIRSRRDHMDTMKDCLLLSSISPNAYGIRSNFHRYLDILFSIIKPTASISSPSYSLQMQNMEHTMELLNQLILLSYCGQNILQTTSLLDQTYRRIMELETNTLQHVILCIQFPAFIASMCDIYFDDADDSHVASEHIVKFRNQRMFSVSKMQYYIMKTRPKETTLTKAAVMRHCLMVMWRWNAYLEMFSFRYDASLTTSTPTITNVEVSRKRTDEKGITVDDMKRWKRHVLNLARFCKDDVDRQLKTDINEIVEMMLLSIDI